MVLLVNGNIGISCIVKNLFDQADIIKGGLFSILAAFCLDETFEPVLLERKAKRMRKETRNPSLRSKLAKTTTFQQELVRALVRPTKMLFMSPIIFCLSSYLAVCFGK